MHIASSARCAILVEGESDRQAVLATAATLDRDLDALGTQVVALGGATNIDAIAGRLGPTRFDLDLLGLCDAGELRFFQHVLRADDIFICHNDLEDELIRALGVHEMVEFIASQGELKTFRTMQKQPAQRERSIDEQLHRFCGIKSGRKVRYAQGIIEWLPADRIPSPLVELVAAI